MSDEKEMKAAAESEEKNDESNNEIVVATTDEMEQFNVCHVMFPHAFSLPRPSDSSLFSPPQIDFKERTTVAAGNSSHCPLHSKDPRLRPLFHKS